MLLEKSVDGATLLSVDVHLFGMSEIHTRHIVLIIETIYV